MRDPNDVRAVSLPGPCDICNQPALVACGLDYFYCTRLCSLHLRRKLEDDLEADPIGDTLER